MCALGTVRDHALTCAGAGIVISPANYAYSSHELAHQLRESGSRAILVHPTLLETAKAAAKEAGWSEQQIKDNFVFAARKRDAPSGAYRTLDDLLDSPPLESETIRDPKEQLAFLCFSSGTTSAAKGVMTTVSNMNSVLSLLDPFKPKASDVIVAALPFSHIYGAPAAHP
jgi:acyl-CoA synthetase (AMP-forming)/AMP-acid ligase II